MARDLAGRVCDDAAAEKRWPRTLTASVATLCTIGPGLGAIGPVEHYGWMNDSTLATLIILMLMGRLEVLPVLVLIVPSYWRGE